MKTFLVNLDRNADRLAAVSKRLAERGIAFERFPAVDGRALAPEERRRSYSPVRAALVRGWGLLPGELGCALSHLGICRRMLADGRDLVCVLEDDAIPGPGFAAALRELESKLDVTRAQVVLLSSTFCEREPQPVKPGLERIEGGMFTDAYVMTRPAAEVILCANFPVCCPADWWGRFRCRAPLELYRLVPPVSRQSSSHDNSEVAGPRPSWVGTWRWKLWRAFGKTADWILWKVTGK